ncbi:hypothetical protein GF339_05070 [candidate division KSB3 bacterium]|uniref:Uncharacterized protein n=1 Tax=candidate division KSB3 bacterium TaxID=2044937 RepID=A0A9D5JU06_9BACT|nr:hypothetical protein [candidate division KSB3 bacterium]MBD3323932.1 hypothetical protein [candidate division KSB3 bacterium]
MKYLHSVCIVLIAGTCIGLFVALESFAVLRTYATPTDSDILWELVPLSRLGGYIFGANGLLLIFWGLYAFIAARLTGIAFTNSLRRDAYTYLPFWLLALALLPFNTFLTHVTEGFLLFSPHSLGYLLLLLASLGVYHLKAHNLQHQSPGANRSSLQVSVNQVPTWRIKVVIFLLSLGIYWVVGYRVTTQLDPTGDEPHYLLIAHSLLHDQDLEILNNYTQQDYLAFYGHELDPHVSFGKGHTIYPGHPIGLPVLLIPFYALKGRQGAVLGMNILAALLAVQIYLLAFAMTRRRGLALVLWGVTCFTPPLLLYSSQMYPEIPSALLLAVAYRYISVQPKKPPGQEMIIGACLAILPWLQQRMILPAVVLLACYSVRPSFISRMALRARRSQRFVEFLPILLFGLSGLLLAGFYYALYGNPLPSAPYHSTAINSVFSLDIFLKEGMLGLLLDQEGGLLLHAPHYLLFFAGLAVLVRRHRSQALWLLVLIASIYLPCAGFTLNWRGAWSPVARYMVALTPLLAIPIAVMLHHARRQCIFYTFGFLSIISLYWSYLFLKTPFFAIMQGNGRDTTLAYSSRLIDFTRYVPSFPAKLSGDALLIGLWVLFIAGFSVVMYRAVRTETHAVSTLSQRDRHTSSPEQKMRAQILTVFRWYGVLIGLVLIFTTLVEHWEQNTSMPHLNTNRQLRTLWPRIDSLAFSEQRLLHERPLSQQTFRFEYLQKERHGEVNQEGERFLVTGPHDPFPRGRYTALFSLTVEENPGPSNEPLARLEVVTRNGTQAWAQKTLYGSGVSPGSVHVCALPFELPVDVADLETRVYFYNRVPLRVQKIRIEPDLGDWYYTDALSALEAEQYATARILATRTAAASESVLGAYLHGVVEHLVGNRQHAQTIFENMPDVTPYAADVHYRLGAIAYAQRNLHTAQQHLEEAIRLLPTHIEAWKTLKEVYQARGLDQQVSRVEHILETLYTPKYPAAVNFGNQIMFLGYSVQNISPGLLHLEYYWRALVPLRKDYVFFVHFEGQAISFQHDHAPHVLDPLSDEPSLYPTSHWQPGELIHEAFYLAAPPGTFSIQLGVWDPEQTRQRLPVIAAQAGTASSRSRKIHLPTVTIR